jgi:DNA-directed RNA polymerase subunit K/omega
MTSEPSADGDTTPTPLRSDVQSVFHLVVVASKRAKQLAAGAPARVDRGTHRHARVAVLEVMAGLVSWSLADAPTAVAPSAPPRK